MGRGWQWIKPGDDCVGLVASWYDFPGEARFGCYTDYLIDSRLAEEGGSVFEFLGCTVDPEDHVTGEEVLGWFSAKTVQNAGPFFVAFPSPRDIVVYLRVIREEEAV